MVLTKQRIIELALEEIGVASYTFDSSPSQYNYALVRLEMMISNWNANGIRIGYPLASTPDSSSINDAVYVPDVALEPMVLGLAIRIAPSYKVIVSAETKELADEGYSNLLTQMLFPTPTRILPNTLPLGQGNKTWRSTLRTYVYQPKEPIITGNDGQLDIGAANANNSTIEFGG